MEIIKCIWALIKNFCSKDPVISRWSKTKAGLRIVRNLLWIVYNAVTAPLVYPVWYLFRDCISRRIYQGTTWKKIVSYMDNNEVDLVKRTLKANGKFLYWLWTYGDSEDPYQTGGMPAWYGTNTFWNRYRWSAFRNPRFNINYMEFRTGRIVQVKVVTDTRDFRIQAISNGIGATPIGVYFKWMKDNRGRWYFIYEDNNFCRMWYFGYTGLLYHDMGNNGGRFETSYRRTLRVISISPKSEFYMPPVEH